MVNVSHTHSCMHMHTRIARTCSNFVTGVISTEVISQASRGEM